MCRSETPPNPLLPLGSSWVPPCLPTGPDQSSSRCVCCRGGIEDPVPIGLLTRSSTTAEQLRTHMQARTQLRRQETECAQRLRGTSDPDMNRVFDCFGVPTCPKAVKLRLFRSLRTGVLPASNGSSEQVTVAMYIVYIKLFDLGPWPKTHGTTLVQSAHVHGAICIDT